MVIDHVLALFDFFIVSKLLFVDPEAPSPARMSTGYKQMSKYLQFHQHDIVSPKSVALEKRSRADVVASFGYTAADVQQVVSLSCAQLKPFSIIVRAQTAI